MLYDIDLAVGLTPEGGAETIISRTNYRTMYYSAAQQLCHHTTSGCAMRSGDLLGSGTSSGPERDSRGSLLELNWGGKKSIALTGGETRSLIEDGEPSPSTARPGATAIASASPPARTRSCPPKICLTGRKNEEVYHGKGMRVARRP